MEDLNQPLIIFDTDMDTDCDDAGALAILLEAHNQKKIKLSGIVADSVSRYAAPCCEAMARYYGVNVPIGAIYEDDYMDTDANIIRFADYRKHSNHCLSIGKGYNRIFAEEIEKTDKNYPSAASLYKELLFKAEDNSIIVLCVGMLTAVAEALCSEADDVIPLSGTELFKKKVKRVITMGNPDISNDFNWGKDTYAAERFFSLCPVPIYISAEGAAIITGENLSTALKSEHPLRRAYETWLGKKNCGRCSWDLIAALYAIEPESPYLMCKNHGNCFYDANEKRLHTNKAENAQCKTIHINCESEMMKKLLNGYMLGNFSDI